MATVTFIKYQKQSAGTLHGVARYVSQKQKTAQEDGQQLVSGQNCTPQLAAQEFLATRQIHWKDGPVWFYHYVQSFSPEENIAGALAHQTAREVAQLRAAVQQAGRKKELSISPPGSDTALSVLVWLILLLLGTMVGMVVLRTIWSGLAAVWSAVKVLIP